MAVEALALERSSLEGSYYLGAVAADSSFVDRLINSNTAVAVRLDLPQAGSNSK